MSRADNSIKLLSMGHPAVVCSSLTSSYFTYNIAFDIAEREGAFFHLEVVRHGFENFQCRELFGTYQLVVYAFGSSCTHHRMPQRFIFSEKPSIGWICNFRTVRDGRKCASGDPTRNSQWSVTYPPGQWIYIFTRIVGTCGTCSTSIRSTLNLTQ